MKSLGFSEHLLQIGQLEGFYFLIGEQTAFELDLFGRSPAAGDALGIVFERFVSEVLKARVTDLRRFAQGGSLCGLVACICFHAATVATGQVFGKSRFLRRAPATGSAGILLDSFSPLYLFSGGRHSPHGVPALAGSATEVMAGWF